MNEEGMIYFWKSTDGNSVYFNTDPEEAKKDGIEEKVEDKVEEDKKDDEDAEWDEARKLFKL